MLDDLSAVLSSIDLLVFATAEVETEMWQSQSCLMQATGLHRAGGVAIVRWMEAVVGLLMEGRGKDLDFVQCTASPMGQSLGEKSRDSDWNWKGHSRVQGVLFDIITSQSSSLLRTPFFFFSTEFHHCSSLIQKNRELKRNSLKP